MLVVLLVVYAALLFYGLGSWGVLETSEARYAEMAREMYVSGDYLHPTFSGLRHYHKPPLTYYLTAAAYALFGVSAWSARVFLQVALLVQLLMMYGIAGTLFRREHLALRATAIYAALPAVLIASRNLTTDLYLTTFLLAGVWAFLRAERRGRPALLLLMYGCWGLAALTKGAGMVILPAVLLPAWYLLHPPERWRPLLVWHLAGAVLGCAIGLSWYAELIAGEPELFHYFVVEQTIKRYTTDQWMRTQPVWFYLATISATAFPWCWALLTGRRSWRVGPPDQTILLWLAAWFILPVLFYSFAQSKLLLYVLPVYPATALLAAYWLGQAPLPLVRRWTLATQIGFTVLLAALVGAGLTVPEISLGAGFFVVAALTGLSVWWLPALLPGEADGLRDQLTVVTLLFSMGLLPLAAHFTSRNELLVNSPDPVVQYVRERRLLPREVYMLNRELPALAFGLQQPVLRLYDGNMPRDTSFEVDTAWHRAWYDVSRPEIRRQLTQRWSRHPALVVSKGRPGPEVEAWLEALGTPDTLGRYLLYATPEGPKSDEEPH